MRYIPRIAVVAVPTIALAAVLTGCSSSAPNTQATGDGTPIEVWSRSDAAAAATYKKVFAAFTQKTGFQVNYQPVTEFDAQLQARAAQKHLPDVLINDAGSLGAYNSQGFLLPIDKSEIDGNANVADASWKQGLGRDGKLYGIPWSRQATITVVRKDWREKLGLPVPKTWEELQALAHAFATRDPDGNGANDTYGMVVPGTATNGYIARWGAPYIWQAGGDFLKDNGDGTYQSVVNSPGTVQGIKFIRDQFCTPGNVVPGSINLTTGDSPFFQQGKAGIYLTGAYNLNPFDKGVGKENVEVIPMPKGPQSTTAWAEGEDIFFGAGSAKHAQQVALASFLLTAEAQKIGMDPPAAGGPGPFTSVVRLPVNTTVDVGTTYADPRWQATADAYAKDSKPFPWNINFIPFRQILADAMNAMAADCNSNIQAGVQKIDEGFKAELSNQGLSK